MIKIDMPMPDFCLVCPMSHTYEESPFFDCYCNLLERHVIEEDAEKRQADCPLTDVAPVRHAHWVLLAPIYNSDGLPTFPVKCSRKECGEIAWRRTDYCPYCGAKMDGDAE